MNISKLTRLVPAPAGYFLLEFKTKKEADIVKHVTAKQPVLCWGCVPDWHDLIPVTPMGVHDPENVYTLLLPDGSVFEPYGSYDGPVWYANESEWQNAVSAEVSAK